MNFFRWLFGDPERDRRWESLQAQKRRSDAAFKKACDIFEEWTRTEDRRLVEKYTAARKEFERLADEWERAASRYERRYL